MPNVALEMLIVLLLIVINGIFSMSEIAVVSARKIRLRQRAAEGDARARTALELANAPNRFLSTVQIGITLVGILAGAYGGATLAAPLSAVLGGIGPLARYRDGIALAVVVLVITFLTLVLGELVPKRIALGRPEGIAATVARPMNALSRIASPLVRLLSTATDLVLRLLRIRPSEEPPVTEDEITTMIAQGTEAGVFEEAEQDIVERVFRLGDRTVSGLMTPRHRITWLDLDDSREHNLRKLAEHPHTRFVICRGGLDHVLGIISIKDLFTDQLEGEPIDLTTALRQPHFVPESMPALRVLELFKQSGLHLALVVDEYGGLEGLVTLNDILEALVGDIPSEAEPPEPRAVRRDDGSWLVDGLLPADEFKEIFGLRSLPGEETGNYRTVGGFVVMRVGRIPHVADRFEWDGLRLEVVDMDGNRVDKVLVAREGTE